MPRQTKNSKRSKDYNTINKIKQFVQQQTHPEGQKLTQPIIGQLNFIKKSTESNITIKEPYSQNKVIEHYHK